MGNRPVIRSTSFLAKYRQTLVPAYSFFSRFSSSSIVTACPWRCKQQNPCLRDCNLSNALNESELANRRSIELRCQVGKTVHDFDAINASSRDHHGIQQIDRPVNRRDTEHHSKDRRVPKNRRRQCDTVFALLLRYSERGLLEKSLNLAPRRQLNIKC